MNENWAKSSYCTTAANCVEVRGREGAVDVRDSKDTGRAALSVGGAAWQAFVTGMGEERRGAGAAGMVKA